MGVLIKILLSTTLVYAIHFAYKSFTVNNFDKVFMPKYQKALHHTFLVVFFFIIFVAYGVFFAVMYGMIKDPFLNPIFIFIAFLVLLAITGSLCLYKFIKNKKLNNSFVLSEKRANVLFILTFLLNIFVFSITLNEMYLIDDTTEFDKTLWLSNLVSCVFLFVPLSYVLLKSNIYLRGINKREWNYVLSPTPKGIEEKHLYVLYSLNSTTLVLSDDPTNKNYPRSVYLYDMNKNSFTCFNRVLNFNDKTGNLKVNSGSG